MCCITIFPFQPFVIWFHSFTFFFPECEMIHHVSCKAELLEKRIIYRGQISHCALCTYTVWSWQEISARICCGWNIPLVLPAERDYCIFHECVQFTCWVFFFLFCLLISPWCYFMVLIPAMLHVKSVKSGLYVPGEHIKRINCNREEGQSVLQRVLHTLLRLICRVFVMIPCIQKF